MTVHNLKILKRYFDDIRAGIKTAEIRKADREFNVGDTLHFKPVGIGPTKVTLVCSITHIVRGGEFGIDEDYDMLSIKLIGETIS